MTYTPGLPSAQAGPGQAVPPGCPGGLVDGYLAEVAARLSLGVQAARRCLTARAALA